MTELNTANNRTNVITPPNLLQPLALRGMFWRPTYLETSAWIEHIPFAFWLVEAHRPRVIVELGSHYGASYFSFCQAVDKLELDTQCFAVDTWKGDEHAGLYDEKVYAKVKAHNDAQYSGFSRLVRSSFDDAVRHFSDGSIDLLHIDGLHTLEAVRHDFDTWLPKLSDRAVVIMHDTNVRERNFGVFKLFEQLKSQYPSFEFVHGHGLGVLAVGGKQSDMLQHLYQSCESETAIRAIQEVFSRLGRACADAFAAIQQQDRANKLTEEVSNQKKQLEEFKQSLEKAKADLTTRSKELTDARTKLQTQIDHHAVERGQLKERATLFQELRTELKEEVIRLQARIDAASSEQHRRASELTQLQEKNLLHQKQTEALATELQERDGKISRLNNESEKNKADLESVQATVTESEAEKAALQHTLIASTAVREQQEAEIVSLKGQLKASEQTCAALNQAQERQQTKLATLEVAVQRLTKEKAVLQVGKDQLAGNVQERFKELATLTQLVNAANKRLSAQEEQAALQKKQILVSEQTLTGQDAEVQRLVTENAILRSDKEKLTKNVQERFKELSKLTEMLDAAKAHEHQAELLQKHISLCQHTQVEPANQLQNLSPEKAELKNGKSAKKRAFLSRIFRHLPKMAVRSKEERKRAQQAHLLRQSEFFDAAWYLERYPDVKHNNSDPARHYLNFGAAEGRNPGPLFNTRLYCEVNPDVVEAKINPLLHYINHGINEGRTIQRVTEK